MEFEYCLPVNLIFGAGKAALLGEQTARYGKRALIVTGRSSAKKSGLLARAEKLLASAGVRTFLFDRVLPNPLSTTAAEGAQLAKQEHCAAVVALGGGSIMDCAKAIAFLACNEGGAFDYIYGRKTGTRSLPIVAVPTTCGTGSEGNCFAVLTDPETNDKEALKALCNTPSVSIIDPELMTTMPRGVLASVGFDALCHSMEAYLSRKAYPLVEVLALYAIGLTGGNLAGVYRDPSDLEGWARLSLASTLGGMVIQMSGVTAPHGLEHPVSGLRNIVHGRGLAALTPVIYGRTIGSAPEKFRRISQQLGGSDENDLVDTLYALLDRIDLRTTLGAEGVKPEDIGWLAENCLRVSKPSLDGYPCPFTREEIRELYREAM